MLFINYFIASLISFFGLILGIILIKIAPEEQKPGKKYFILLQNLFFILSVILLLYFLKIDMGIIFLTAILLTYFISRIKIKDYFRKSEFLYFLLAIIFFLSLRKSDLFLIEGALIFLFGMPTSSLLFDKRKKNYLKVILRNIIFLVVALLLFLISPLIF